MHNKLSTSSSTTNNKYPKRQSTSLIRKIHSKSSILVPKRKHIHNIKLHHHKHKHKHQSFSHSFQPTLQQKSPQQNDQEVSSSQQSLSQSTILRNDPFHLYHNQQSIDALTSPIIEGSYLLVRRFIPAIFHFKPLRILHLNPNADGIFTKQLALHLYEHEKSRKANAFNFFGKYNPPYDYSNDIDPPKPNFEIYTLDSDYNICYHEFQQNLNVETFRQQLPYATNRYSDRELQNLLATIKPPIHHNLQDINTPIPTDVKFAGIIAPHQFHLWPSHLRRNMIEKIANCTTWTGFFTMNFHSYAPHPSASAYRSIGIHQLEDDLFGATQQQLAWSKSSTEQYLDDNDQPFPQITPNDDWMIQINNVIEPLYNSNTQPNPRTFYDHRAFQRSLDNHSLDTTNEDDFLTVFSYYIPTTSMAECDHWITRETLLSNIKNMNIITNLDYYEKERIILQIETVLDQFVATHHDLYQKQNPLTPNQQLFPISFFSRVHYTQNRFSLWITSMLYLTADSPLRYLLDSWILATKFDLSPVVRR